MSTREEIKAQLLSLSHDLGRPEYQLALLGEGNTSARLDAETFLVKASGSRLMDLSSEQLVEVRAEAILPMLDQELGDEEIEAALIHSRVRKDAPKPSVETTFHAWLLRQEGIAFVGHTHPVSVNKILCSDRAVHFADRRLFPDEIVCCGPRSLLVDYVDPGTLLGSAIRSSFTSFVSENGFTPRVILVRNHGLIAVGPSAGSVLATTLMAAKAAEIFVGASTVGGPVFMDPADVARIAGRIDEKYRQQQLKLI